MQAVAEPIDGRPMSSQQWWVLALCTLVILLDGLDLQAAAFTGPSIAAQWQLERSSMGPVCHGAGRWRRRRVADGSAG